MKPRAKPKFKKTPYMSLSDMTSSYNQRVSAGIVDGKPVYSPRATRKLREDIIKRRFDMGM